MKPKYEISVWQDEFDEELNRFVEKKLIIIGSDTMTSESRAREPKLVSNINGTNKFTFNMYHSYIDTRTGEKIKNPYIQYLVNERKIKVFWKDEWYNLLIKQIKEDQVNHLFTYTCEDAYITELSRTGFELEFNTELQNNIGTAKELVESVIKNTDWRFSEKLSDNIYQETEEAVYEVQVTSLFQAIREPDGKEVTIYPGKILIFYSQAPDIDNLKPSLQFYYTGGGFEHGENEMLVTNGTSYHVDVEWEIDKEKGKATAKINNDSIWILNFKNGLSKNYRAKRFVNSNKTSYNSVLKRYVNDFKYNDSIIHGYQVTEFNDASFVINLFTNSSNFANVSGWLAPDEQESKLMFRLYPEYGKETVVKDYIATSFLRLQGQKTYINTGISNNRAYITNGFIKGEKYILRLKIRKGTDTIPGKTYFESLSLKFNIEDCFQLNDTLNKDDNNWFYVELDCQESCSYEKLLDKEIKLSIENSNSYYWLEEIQFYKAIKGIVDSVEKYLEPNQFNAQAIAQTNWKYYNDKDNENISDKKNFVYMYTLSEPWDEAIQLTNNYMRYGTIEEDNSNRFNILQSIAETFECWVRFYIESEENGTIKYDEYGPRKFVYLKREAGQETGIGFIYGVDLKGIIRNVKSDKISTKIIVQDNDNEFGQNGFCSIARSIQNFPRDNVIYNFDYYISHGLLEKDIVYNDLYSNFNEGSSFYTQLHQLNSVYDNNLKIISNKKTELTRQTANYTVYKQYITSAREEINSIENDLYKLTSTSNMTSVINYANNNPRNTKVTTLLNDRALIMSDLNRYSLLLEDLVFNIEDLQSQISILDEEQDTIIKSLNELNTIFYKRYGRFIQEGTWSDENYWNDDLYYLDAVQVAYTSSRPQISYEINVLRLSDLDDYASKVFYLGDISFVQDTEYFGYLSDKITPYKERVVLTEITSYFETPDKDIIKVQNYKTQFDDLFQRITAAVQNLQFNEGKYARVSNIVNEDGTIKSSVIQNTFNLNKDLVYGAQNDSATIDNTGITVIDTTDKEKIVRVTSGGIFVTNDGGETWKNAIRGDGVSTDALTAGHIDTERITIYNGDYPSFCWDPYGLNAYHFENNEVNTAQFVRFDQYGIYGIYLDDAEKAEQIDFKPISEEDVFNKAKFGLTWNRFFMKASNSNINDKRMVTITSEDGILVTDKDGKSLFKCSPNFEREDVAAQIGGWKITENSIESFIQENENRYISINASGNIGCYGGVAHEYEDYVYVIKIDNDIPIELLERLDGQKLNQGISENTIIYPFFSSVGPTKTTFEEGDRINNNYTNYTNVPTQGRLSPISSVIFNEGEISYKLRSAPNLNLIIKTECIDTDSSKIGTIITQIDPVTGNEINRAVYTYHFKLIFSYIKQEKDKAPQEIILFTIPYTEIITSEDVNNGSGKEETPKKKRYVPAADTTWTINKDGTAIFHNIIADGGKIAGWFIDNEKIYQTTNGEPDGPIKTQLNSNGTGNKDGFDYSIITDAINAAMANIGGVLMSGGLINGYSIAAIATMAAQAVTDAWNAQQTAATAYKMADNASNVANQALALAKIVNNIAADLSERVHALEQQARV